MILCQRTCRLPQILFFSLLALSLGACVPKATYEDKLAELERLKTERASAEWDGSECNTQSFTALQDQVKSLDVLSQELVDRNTELSEEVARLRRQEAERGRQGLDCQERLRKQAADYEQQLERTRLTYEDMVDELRKQLQRQQARP
jgi:hypothetical protein